MGEKQQRNRYKTSFKKEVVTFYKTNKISISRTAQHFGITPGMVHKWLHKFDNEAPGETEKTLSFGTKVNNIQNELNKLKDEMTTMKKALTKIMINRHLEHNAFDSKEKQSNA